MEADVATGMKTEHLLISALALAVTTTVSLAQPLPPPPNTQPVAATDQVSGTVSMYLLNPRGEVDGLLLADGTQVKFPPHMSADLTRVVRPNDRITAQGTREVSPVFTAFTIANANGQLINEARPTRPPAPPDLRGVTLKSMQADGKVQVVLHAPRGEVEGAVLDNGTIVRIAPHASAQFNALLQPGATISAKGYGTENELGRCLEATEIGAAGQMLTPIYSVAAMPPGPR
jgi:hypothetical protein